MMSSQQSAVIDDNKRLKEDLEQTRVEKAVLLIKFKKLMVAYR